MAPSSSFLLLLLLLLLLVGPIAAFQPRCCPNNAQRPLPFSSLRLAASTITAVGTSSSSSSSSPPRPAIEPKALPVPVLKQHILQLAAGMDRGKLQDPLVAEKEGGLYQAEKALMISLLEALAAKTGKGGKLQAELLEGDWELVYTTRQLFRSSPFFQAIARAYNDPNKSELFFKLHELQTCSWGVSQIGRVAQSINLQEGELLSEFDSILFSLTTIPILGWFKLLPTFGGRVISIADRLKVTEEEGGAVLRLDYELAKTSFKKVKGLGVLPLLGDWMEGRVFPTKEVWKLLPWNWSSGGPKAAVRVVYVDDDFRIVKEEGAEAGGYFVYARPLL